MKKLILGVFAAVLMLCNSVVSWAAIKLPFVTVVDGISHIGVFHVKDAPAAIRDFWVDTIESGNKSLFFAFKSIDKNRDCYIFDLFSVPLDASVTYSIYDSPPYDYFLVDFNRQVFYSSFVYYMDDPDSGFVPYPSILEPIKLSAHGFLKVSYFIGGNHASVHNLPPLMAPYLVDLTAPFYIDDDINPPEPPDPPPSSSSVPDPPKPPDPVQPPIAYPTFPKVENKYITYDTTVWNEFADRIRSSIGSSTNIGFQLFGIILGIFVVIQIVRKFAHSGH